MEHHHDGLRQLFIEKARDVDELRARVGIAKQLKGGEEIGTHECIVDGLTFKHRLLGVHLFIGELEEEVKCGPVLTAQGIGGPSDLCCCIEQAAMSFGIDAGGAGASAVVAEGIEEVRAGFAEWGVGEGAELAFNLFFQCLGHDVNFVVRCLAIHGGGERCRGSICQTNRRVVLVQSQSVL